MIFNSMQAMFYGISSSSVLNIDYHLYLMVGLSVILGAVTYVFFAAAYDSHVQRRRLDTLLDAKVFAAPVRAEAPAFARAALGSSLSRVPGHFVPSSRYFIECHRSEELWVIFFSLVVFVQGFSYGFNTLYAVGLPPVQGDDNPILTVQVVGNQWFWKVYYPDITWFRTHLQFEVHRLEKGDELFARPPMEGQWEVDNRLYLPAHSAVRFVVTSDDVIHSFFVRDLEVKIDANPGRVNEVFSTPHVAGVYAGYCAELCGSGHSSMPLVIQVVPVEDFVTWTHYRQLLAAMDLDLHLFDLLDALQAAGDGDSAARLRRCWEALAAPVAPYWVDARHRGLVEFLGVPLPEGVRGETGVAGEAGVAVRS